MAKIPKLKYSFKKEKDKKGKEGYRYTGKQKDGTTSIAAAQKIEVFYLNEQKQNP